MAALGNKRCSSMKARVEEDAKLRFGVVTYTRSFGRKRILISTNEEMMSSVGGDSSPTTPLKRLCTGGFLDFEVPERSSQLESLPPDVLVRILCGVDHDDLKQLIHVSKTIKDATVIAKKYHFEYSTPRKVRAFRTPINLEDSGEGLEEIEAPNAPKQLRSYKSRLGGKKLADISVALFTSPRKRGLFVETGV